MFSILRRISGFVIKRFENFFFWYGKLVATNPWWAILGCLIITGLSAIGLLEYRTENNAFKLWIPENSEFLKNYEYLQDHFPPDTRFNNLIVAKSNAENVLTPEVVKLIFELRTEITKLETKDGKKWDDLCKKIPTGKLPIINSAKSMFSPLSSSMPLALSSPKQFMPSLTSSTRKHNCSVDPSEIFCNVELYCTIYELVDQICLETGILELWGFDKDIYETLEQQDILDKLNQEVIMSVPYGRPISNIDSYIKPIRDDSSGQIIGASAISLSWFGQVNLTGLTDADVSNSGSGLPVDQTTLEFENLLKEKMEEIGKVLLDKTKSETFINVARSYEDVAGETILNDAVLMPVGFTIVFLYIMIMLGRFDCVHARAFLSMVGVGAIGLTILVTYGLCSGFGLFFGPMHNVIPFLFLGIGIDDMFVIMQAFDNLRPSEKRQGDDAFNIAIAMRHAGVAITVTSITDVVVFGVGASTTLPSLRSFCLYCAVGMTFVYFFQATFFVACLAIDQRRIKQQRNGFLPCFKHNIKEREPTEEELALDASANSTSITGKIFRRLGEFLVNPFIRVFVFLATFSLLGVAIWGVTRLETKFESEWFLPPDSYLIKWFDASKTYFPSDGVQVTVYMTDLDYRNEMKKIEGLLDSFEKSTDIIKSVDSWYPNMKNFFNNKIGLTDDGGVGIPDVALDAGTFNNYTSLFLFSRDGATYSPNFNTKPKIKCGESYETLEMSSFSFVHTRFNGPSEHIPAMNKVKDLIREQKFSKNVFALTAEYSNWETDEIIDSELYRNLGISMACVFVTTLILLADIIASVQVMICVLMTLIDVMGYMHFWGLTIDVVSSIIVIISIGLCVDYSAHIAHTFLTTAGSRKDRAIATVMNIGPAVLNGGFSTFLALVLLATSKSHVFSSFFKVFFLVISFGLFHGLIFFPAFLSLFGPSPYHEESKSMSHTKTKPNDTTKF